jgi:hypothetical protein
LANWQLFQFVGADEFTLVEDVPFHGLKKLDFG